MRNVLILIFISLIFSGCIFRQSPFIKMEPYTKMTLPYMHILTPSSYPKTPFKTSSIHDNKTTIYFHRTIPNMIKEDITIRVENLKVESLHKYVMLHKETSKELEKYFENQPLTEWQMTNNMERGVNYVKEYIDFIGGLKCTTYVESQTWNVPYKLDNYQSSKNLLI